MLRFLRQKCRILRICNKNSVFLFFNNKNAIFELILNYREIIAIIEKSIIAQGWSKASSKICVNDSYYVSAEVNCHAALRG